MGKKSKQGAALRAKKRGDETYADLEKALTDQVEIDRVTCAKDEDLFVIDTNRRESSLSKKADRRARYRNKLLNSDDTRKRKHEPSDKDLRQIHRVLQHHGESGAIILARMGKARLDKKSQEKGLNGMMRKKTKYDLWDEITVSGVIRPADALPADPIDSVPSLSKKLLKARKHAQLAAQPTLALEIAHPGQSYHPDKEQHQVAIGEALTIEIRRNEAEVYKSTPVSSGLSSFTQSYTIHENNSEEESSEDEDDGENSNIHGNKKLVKKKEKLTRAQRNKQKRIKAEKTAIVERKQTKMFMHQINEVHKLSKVVKDVEMKNTARQQELLQLKAEKKSEQLGQNLWNSISLRDPIRAPSLPVALTEELEGQSRGGSLRTVTPKGSLVTDRLESMVARKMILKKKVDGRRIVQGKRRKKVVGEKGTEYLLI